MGNYYASFSLRVSEELIAKIKSIATVHKRSTNKEIEFALEQYVRQYEQGQDKSPEEKNDFRP